jgi:iron complex outermembrane receptor protein
MQLGNAGSLSAGVQYYWQDEYYSRIFNGVTDTIEEWNVWNATLRFTP